MSFRARMEVETRVRFDASDLARWTGGEWRGGSPDAVAGFSIDTRTLKPGELFVALRGDHGDGHAFAARAIAAGACGVLYDDDHALGELACSRLRVADARLALMACARGYRNTLTCRMVAVTGSVGKTTVKELIADMLQPVGLTARSKGNWNNDLGMPLSLLAVPQDARFGVFEVGMSHPGDLAPLCAVLRPDLALVTCIGPVHQENFPDTAAIADEKATVYRSLEKAGVAIINADDAHVDLLRNAARGNRWVDVSGHPGADIVFRRTDAGRGLFVLFEKATGTEIEMASALPGAYFVQDAALAAAAARALEVPWPVIAHAVRHYQPLTMRWNRASHHGVVVINDAYNANPVSMRAAVEAFMEEPVGGRRWAVLGGMRELGTDEQRLHEETGAALAGHEGLELITVGERGRWLADGAAGAGIASARLTVTETHEQAAQVLNAVVHEGDAILFKGSRGEAVEAALQAWLKLREGTDGKQG